VLETLVTRSSNNPTCTLGLNWLEEDVEACAMFSEIFSRCGGSEPPLLTYVIRDLMKLLFNTVLVAVQALRARAHQQSVFSDSSSDSARSSSLWSEKYGAQSDLVFTGPLSFAHLPYARCLEENTSPAFDIALLGMPFDTAVTYRPGARFGPTGIRIGSRRIHNQRGWSLSWGLDPYQQGLDIIDCGDVSHRSSLFTFRSSDIDDPKVPLSPFDNALALDQMEVAYSTLLQHDVAHTGLERTIGSTRPFSKDNKEHPRIVSYAPRFCPSLYNELTVSLSAWAVTTPSCFLFSAL
jgi:agmatinase